MSLARLLPTLALAFPLSAQSTTLNSPLALYAPGSVPEYAITLDGSRIVYASHDGDVNDMALFSVPFDLSAPRIPLTANLPVELRIESVVILPSGDRVIFRGFELGGPAVLYVVPIDGGSPPLALTTGHPSGPFKVHPDEARLIFNSFGDNYVVPLDGSSAPAPIGDLSLYCSPVSWITPDGERVIYTGNDGVHAAFYSSALDTPGSLIEYSTNWTPGSVLWAANGVSADGQHVLFKLQVGGNAAEVFSSPIDGSSAPVQIHPPMTNPSMSVESFETTPFDNRVVFVSNHLNVLKFQLYTAPADHSTAAVRISAPLPSGANVGDFVISPDGQWVAYEADVNTPGMFELFVVPVGGGVVRQLNTPYVAGGSTFDFDFTPDSAWVMYLADAVVDERRELFAAPVDGSSAAVHVSGSGASAGFAMLEFAAGPPGGIVFRGGSPDGTALYSAPRDGSSPAQRLSGPNIPDGDVVQFKVSADGTRVSYRADTNRNDHFEVLGTHFGATRAPVTLSELLYIVAGDVQDFRISPDSQWVVYFADQEVEGLEELFTVPIAGGAAPVPIADIQPANSYLNDYLISPDSQWVVFQGNRDDPSSTYLYRTPIDGSALPVRINDVLPSNKHIAIWSIEGDRVLYLAESTETFGRDLFSVPLDLSTAPVRLNSTQVVNGRVEDYAVNSTGTRVVFRGDVVVNNRAELFSSPVDGSASPVVLHPAMPASGDVFDYVLSPDGQTVAFTADLLTDQQFQVFSIPIDGSGPATLVSHSHGAQGDSYASQFSENSARVLYASYPNINTDIGLHAANPDGSGHVQLTPPMVAGGDLWSFLPGPAGTVLYSADSEVDGVLELFVTDDAGSFGPIRLSGDLTPGGDVFEFLVTPSGTSAIYLADEFVNEQFEIFIVPLDGSAPRKPLNGPLAAGGDAKLPFDFLRGQPVYLSDERTNGKTEAFLRMIRNSISPVRLSDVMESNRDVSQAALSPDERYFVYRADRDEDDVFELYSKPTEIAPVHKP